MEGLSDLPWQASPDETRISPALAGRVSINERLDNSLAITSKLIDIGFELFKMECALKRVAEILKDISEINIGDFPDGEEDKQ